MKKSLSKKTIENISLIIVLLCIIFITLISILGNLNAFLKNTAAHIYLISLIILPYPVYTGLKWIFQKINQRKTLIVSIWIVMIILLAISYYLKPSYIILSAGIGAGLILNAICWKINKIFQTKTTIVDKAQVNPEVTVNLEDYFYNMNEYLKFSIGALNKFAKNEPFDEMDSINWLFHAKKKSCNTPSVLHACIFALIIIDKKTLNELRTNDIKARYIQERILFDNKVTTFDHSIISSAKSIIEKEGITIDNFGHFMETQKK